LTNQIARSMQSSLVLNYASFRVSQVPFSFDGKGHDIGSFSLDL